MDLTYIPPKAPPRPFAKGDTVEVLDRNHRVLSRQLVVRAGPKVVRTGCERRWTQKGEWLGEDRAWPFPSIRLAAS